ncbi:ImmA/IrrE family metallo-endopeptidase [Brevibacillus borstelensis]|uniref:ImmA/IrrE family metallo-endopeptidase n=1 Tax=Brevibacillus borstelensis TaxID=45462 RepID=UPI00068C25ED|nr:ImmA/IrrE family metallo-endopeptidase [Brevibacillus borstelensis]
MFNLSYYQQTDLEKSVSQFYLRLGIIHPSDLSEETIASALDIELFREPYPSMCYQEGDYTSILIDSRQSRATQREHFYHELGHILRGHVGKQHKMIKSFRRLQEEQAEHFTIYAAIPFYMVSKLLLPQDERDTVKLFADEFGVTYELASRRLYQIKNRIYHGWAREQFLDKIRSQYTKAEPHPYSSETLRLLGQLQLQVQSSQKHKSSAFTN